MVNKFPKVKFVNNNTLMEQFEHTLTEAKEVMTELKECNTQRVVEELLDLEHSVESCLWICEEKLGVDVEEARARVIKKNMDRGYYTV